MCGALAFFKEGGKTRPITRRKASTRGNSRAENKARKKTIRSMNYRGGDYVGPNPSPLSVKLDRARKSKQPWEKNYRKSKRRR